MHAYTRIHFADVTYQVPTEAIAQHRANYLNSTAPGEYHDLDKALAATRKLFADEQEVVHWVRNNMSWNDDLKPYSMVVDMAPATRDLVDAQIVTSERKHEYMDRGLNVDLDQLPAVLLIERLIRMHPLCSVARVNDGRNGVLQHLVLINADEAATATYIAGLNLITNAVISKQSSPLIILDAQQTQAVLNS